MPDPQPLVGGWGEALAAALGAGGGVIGALLRVRGLRPEVERLRKNLHNTSDVAQTAILRVAVVEANVKTMSDRLERIESKLDRALERE